MSNVVHRYMSEISKGSHSVADSSAFFSTNITDLDSLGYCYTIISGAQKGFW